MNKYKTSQIASIMKIHPNTVRLYEEIGLVEPAQRLNNGYRMFNDNHILQYKLARYALSMDKRHKTIRKKAILISKNIGTDKKYQALILSEELINDINIEKDNIDKIKEKYSLVITGKEQEEKRIYLTRKKAAQYINTSADSIRNWENKGLLQISRRLNGYRIYIEDDIEKMRIIKVLKGLGYSLNDIKIIIDKLDIELQNDEIYLYGQSRQYKNIMKDCDRYFTDLQKAHDISMSMNEIVKDIINGLSDKQNT